MLSKPMAITLICAVAASAHADLFSFASDGNSDGSTFLGGRQVLSRFRDAAPVDPTGVTVGFLWDADENGPGASVLIPSMFRFQADFTNHDVQNVLGVFINSYSATGFYEYRTLNPVSELILRVEFTSAIFSSVSGSANTWGATATMQAQSRTDAGLRFIAGSALPGANFSNAVGDFAFTLTNLRSTAGGAVTLNDAGNPTAEWRSEGSWSAHVTPTPGSLTLLGLGAIAAVRRRR